MTQTVEGKKAAPTEAGGRKAAATEPATGTPQHLQALERANTVRLARAELKRQVAAGRVAVADVILDCPWEAESMSVSDLIVSQRRWGRTRCRRLLQAIPVPEQKTVGSLTDRQRQALADQLRR